MKVIGFRDSFFCARVCVWGGGSYDVIVSDRFLSENFLNPGKYVYVRNKFLSNVNKMHARLMHQSFVSMPPPPIYEDGL